MTEIGQCYCSVFFVTEFPDIVLGSVPELDIYYFVFILKLVIFFGNICRKKILGCILPESIVTF